jgi:hypothetical protein
MLEHDDDLESIDKKAAETDITLGARALEGLINHAGDDWTRWEAVIRGWRALRSLAYIRAQTTDMASQVYRDAMSYLLSLKKHAIYDRLDKPTRSFMYKLCDHLEEISLWYAGLPAADKMRWKHPQAIAKHCPAQFLSGKGRYR